MTGLPNIPTDNLYKFFFIAGITIIILCNALFFTQYNVIREKLDTIELSVLKYKNEKDNLKEDVDALYLEINKINKGLSNIIIDSTEIFALLKQHKNEVSFYREQHNLLKIKTEQLQTKNRESFLNSKLISLGLKQLDRQTIFFGFILFWVVVFFFIGMYMTVYGYKKWNTLVQKPTDEKLKIELEQLKKNLLI